MAEAVFSVVHAGPHVTVQDGGRPGLMRYGVPASGPMDRMSLRIANAALGNPPGQAGIEVSLGGLVLDCRSGAVTLAVVGGGFIVGAGERTLGSWQVLTVRAGERLTIRPGPWGNWTCLAFAGQLQAPCWLGSRATHVTSGLGGGRLLAGQELTIAGAEVRERGERRIPCPIWARPRAAVRAVLGPQERCFAPGAVELLTSAPFRLTDAYDRMGVRLHGPQLETTALSLPSEPILRGSVQVSGDGVATVLLADHQTTGGYPKIATLIGEDIDGFVQLRPHDFARFRLVSPEEAVGIARHRARQKAAWLATMARAGA
ncbi:biotin-dependent carboxyltransferase family protein [Rhodobacter sp. SGA-6-6]|uniref:5-oxoprolinase subunit C family protein n=1 Tax=Rhodobacter sp. SGA-6-6 TaxID=2710882 RepID=UPI001981ADCB|nr:biotin-dependent carboxyltransferase family protein [Rhodobacter sp. SGA-6-6]